MTHTSSPGGTHPLPLPICPQEGLSLLRQTVLVLCHLFTGNVSQLRSRGSCSWDKSDFAKAVRDSPSHGLQSSQAEHPVSTWPPSQHLVDSQSHYCQRKGEAALQATYSQLTYSHHLPPAVFLPFLDRGLLSPAEEWGPRLICFRTKFMGHVTMPGYSSKMGFLPRGPLELSNTGWPEPVLKGGWYPAHQHGSRQPGMTRTWQASGSISPWPSEKSARSALPAWTF